MFGKKKQEDETPNKPSSEIPDELKGELQIFSAYLLMSFIQNPMSPNPVMKEQYHLLLSKGLTREDILGSSNEDLLIVRERFHHEVVNLSNLIKSDELPKDMKGNFGLEMLSSLGTMVKKFNTPKMAKVMDDLVTNMIETYIMH